MEDVVDVPVIIVGGGGCGLTLSSFLSDYGIEHFLFERHEGTSIVPKAHYLNQRTMEIFRQHAMADEIHKQSAPSINFSQVAWATSLGGSEREDRRVIHKRGCFGGDDGSTKTNVYKPQAWNTDGRPKGIADMVSIHFRADLSQYWDERVFACHFINGSCSTVFESGAIVPLGPTWGKHSEEWVFHFGFDLNDENRFAEGNLLPRVRELLKIPDLAIEVLKISHWVLERVLADKYTKGRIFMAGDSVHRRPPTTGLGLNTCIEDSLNLAWKLALVLNNKANKELLNTYETERRPIGRRNCDWGLFTFKNSSVINTAIGLLPGQKEANKLSFSQLFEDSEIGRSRRAQVQIIIDTQCIEFSAHDIELGFSYKEGFLIDDGTDVPPSDPCGQTYIPTTRPGHRLPHAWIQQNNHRVSTHDLVGRDVGFLLITDLYGKDWVAISQTCSTTYDIRIKTVEMGQANDFAAEFRDHNEEWERVSGLKRGGAILVRPDNFVAWRSRSASRTGGEELSKAIQYLFQQSGTSLAK